MDVSAKLIGQIAGVLAIIEVIPYIISIIRGHTKPERATFAIWSLVDIVTVTSYIAVGATTTIFVPIIFAATSILIFLLSLKFGMGGINKLDIVCLIISAVAILLWIATNDPFIALYGNLLAVSLGFIPTIKKSYYLPQTENTLSWGLSTTASVLNVCALTTLQPGIAILPIMGAIGSIIVIFLLLFPNRRLRRYPVKKVRRAAMLSARRTRHA